MLCAALQTLDATQVTHEKSALGHQCRFTKKTLGVPHSTSAKHPLP